MTQGYENLSLDGRVIIVTGAGAGIGAATSRLIAARGACVVLADLDAANAQAVVEEIRGRGGKAAFVRTDVTREDDVKAMVAFAVSTFGGLHGAFNNAGIDNGHTSVVETSLEAWRQNLDVNLTGVFLCLKHEIAHLMAHGGGAVVNTSSAAGAVGFANAVAYTSAKHGVVGLTRAAAADCAGRGVRVNTILPGSVDTPMLKGALEDAELRAKVEAGHPIGRVAQATEIAETAAWLLSDAASFVTGAAVNVDGGWTMI